MKSILEMSVPHKEASKCCDAAYSPLIKVEGEQVGVWEGRQGIPGNVVGWGIYRTYPRWCERKVNEQRAGRGVLIYGGGVTMVPRL